MKFFFVFIMLLHGLIHLIGFAKAFNLAHINRVPGKTIIPVSASFAKAAGLGWLLACIFFITALTALLLNKDWWLFVAAFALVTSQMMIILYWKDAKAGTIPNIIIALVVLFGFALEGFTSRAKTEVTFLLSSAVDHNINIVNEKMLDSFPAPVKRYLHYAGVVGRPMVSTVRISQMGKFTMKAGQSPVDFDAGQYFSVEPVSFIWLAQMRKAGVPFVEVRDKYINGKGNMFAKAGGMFTIVNATGTQMDDASLMRFLSEMIWFPSSFLSKHVSFEVINDSMVHVTLNDQGRKATAIMYIDSEGKLTQMTAKRLYEKDGKYSLETWQLPVKQYGVRSGCRIPVKGSAVWKLKEGDFEYIDLTVTEVMVNPPLPE